MPGNYWTEAAMMAASGLLVAMVAVPAGLLAWAARPPGEPLLPRWKPWRVPWGVFEVMLAFVLALFVMPMIVNQLLAGSGFYEMVYGPGFPAPNAKGVDPEKVQQANTLRVLWTQLFALPLTVGLLWLAARSLYPGWRIALAGHGSTAGKIWLAVLAWLAITPSVLVLNAVVNAIFLSLGLKPEEHSLTKLGSAPAMDQVLFVLEACFFAPFLEELFFRGILLPWCVQRMKIAGAGLSPATAARPWLVLLGALAVAWLFGGGRTGPIVFAALLIVGLAVLWRYSGAGPRRIRTVYASAALFAVVHSSVWPSPVPLFVLGLALGWLAVRTNGILVPVIVHGLFNAVSAVFVLMSGAK